MLTNKGFLPGLKDLRHEFNPTTLLSVGAFTLSMAFIAIGHHHLFMLQDDGAQFEFFLPPLLILILYALGYASLVNHTVGFRPGLISARAVMRSITTIVAISFAAAGYAVFHQDWANNVSGFVSFAGVPLTMIVFMWTYGQYAECMPIDVRTTAPKTGLRLSGSGRRTLWLLTILTMSESSYVFFSACTSSSGRDLYIWLGLMAIAGSFALCFVILVCFNNCVSVEKDRGVRAQ
jgi:hypothetical protein